MLTYNNSPVTIIIWLCLFVYANWGGVDIYIYVVVEMNVELKWWFSILLVYFWYMNGLLSVYKWLWIRVYIYICTCVLIDVNGEECVG